MVKYIIILFILVTGLYSQDVDEIFKFYYQQGGISTLSANSNTVWAGFYPAIGTVDDTVNPTAMLEIFHKKAQYRIRQNGTVTSIDAYIHLASAVDTFKVRIIRPDNPLVNSSVGTVVDSVMVLGASLVNGLNSIPCSMNVREGDMYSVYYSGTINGIQLTDGALSDSVRTFTSQQNDVTSKNWGLGTASSKRFGVRFYMQAPAIVFIGNSIIDGGGLEYNSGASNLNYQLYDVRQTISYKTGTYGNWTYQNMGVSSQAFIDHIQPRFKTDATELYPRIIVLEGGTNDLSSGASYTNLTTALRKAIDSAYANNTIPIYISIPPRNGFTNAIHRRADSVNSYAQTYIATKNGYFIDTRTHTGRASDSGDVGNRWWFINDFSGTDYLHPCINGNGKYAGMIMNVLKTRYLVNDTAQSYLLSSTTLTDTSKAKFPLTVSATAFNFLGIDSLNFKWKKGVNGTVTSNRMTYTLGSSSVTSNAYTHSYAPDTSIFIVGDTVYYTYDVNGYSDLAGSYSTFRIQQITPYYPDSLIAYWDYSDLTDGAVSSWADRIGALALANATGSQQPVKSSSGVTFDGGDGLYATGFARTTYPISFEWVVKVVDTNSANRQFLFAMRNSTNNINGSLCVETNAAHSYAKLQMFGYTGSVLVSAMLSANIHIGSYTHFVVTKSTTDIKLYVNGVLISELASGGTGANSADFLSLGCKDNSASDYVSNGTIYRLGRIYKGELTQAQVTQNYLYEVSRGYLGN